VNQVGGVQQNTAGDDSRLPMIVVTGFIATGKTTVARSLADMLGLAFVDTDAEIERSTGRTIADIFAGDGEARFRALEKELCERINDRRGTVIATGGGTLLDEATFQLFAQRATIVLLEASLDTLSERLGSDRVRPLLSEDDKMLSNEALRRRIAELLENRAPVYNKISIRIDTSDLTPDEAAARIAPAIGLPLQSMTVSPTGLQANDHGGSADMPRGRYGVSQIKIGRGVLSRIGEHLKDIGLGTHAFLLMPDKTRDIFLTQIQASLHKANIPFSVVRIEDGDARKDLDQANRIIDRLIECGARRDATVIPVGGGVTGDIGGFAASVFMRGVPLVHVPTTLLAQVDSSIGGKVGVNHPLAKNLIGSFYQPHLVLNDPCTLRTLPLEEVSNGMAEVVKYALIASEAFFEYLEKQTSADAGTCLRDIGFLERCVVDSARIKCQIVNASDTRWRPRINTAG
jgi:3-dehydroquinate synthetase